MVELNEIKQYVNNRLGKVTTINDLDFTLSSALEIKGQFCIIFTVDNDSLVFEVENSIDGFLMVITDNKVGNYARHFRVDSKDSFIRILYVLLDEYAKNRDKFISNGIEQDILNWH